MLPHCVLAAHTEPSHTAATNTGAEDCGHTPLPTTTTTHPANRHALNTRTHDLHYDIRKEQDTHIELVLERHVPVSEQHGARCHQLTGRGVQGDL